MLMGTFKWVMLMGVLRVMINNLLAEITHFHPYIFRQFPLWSPDFIFTVFSPYPKKRFPFWSLPLHQRWKMHMWQTAELKKY